MNTAETSSNSNYEKVMFVEIFFKTNYYLIVRRRIYSGARPNFFNVRKKSFTNKSNFTQHQLTYYSQKIVDKYTVMVISQFKNITLRWLFNDYN